MGSPRRKSQVSPLLIASTSSSSRELAKLSVELLNKEPSDLVTKLDSYHPILRVRRFSRLNSTRRISNLLDLVTPLVSPSRVLPRTKRFPPEISFTTKRTVSSSQSRVSPPWSLFKSTLVF